MAAPVTTLNLVLGLWACIRLDLTAVLARKINGSGKFVLDGLLVAETDRRDHNARPQR